MKQLNEKLYSDVFLTLKNYIQNAPNSEHVTSSSLPHELKKLLPSLTQDGNDESNLLNDINFILDKSVKTIHPLFLNQLFGGFDQVAWYGEVISSLLNPTMATFEIAPVLTLMEKQIVSEILKLIGFTQGEGIMVTGGSNSNLLAMLCARTEYAPNIRLNGFEHNRYRVYVSAEAHYSFDKAANIVGIGTQNLILVPANEKGEMIPSELERIISTDVKEGYVPIMVGVTFGTTVLGAFDPIIEISKICTKHKIWLHVDAAWGGGVIFSQAHKYLARGIELADSVAFDAHKTMGVPLITSFFLTKHPTILKNTNRGGGAEYLFHEYDNSEWDTGTYSLQCGRRGDILKFWLMWRHYGSKGLSEKIDHLFDLSQFTLEKIKQEPRFKIIHANYFNICFQVISPHSKLPENHNDFTLRVRNDLIKNGKAMVNYAQRPDGTIFLRLVFPNPLTEKKHIINLLNLILEAADRQDRA
jgi:glutamate/tyrosine decarboxylase-like PLP-dependent enzyme